MKRGSVRLILMSKQLIIVFVKPNGLGQQRFKTLYHRFTMISFIRYYYVIANWDLLSFEYLTFKPNLIKGPKEH